MKLSIGSILAAMLWAAAVHAQAFPDQRGPANAAPVNPDERTPLSRPAKPPPGTTGMAAGTPGPYLPNANDPTKSSPTSPKSGASRPPTTGKQ